MRLRLVIIRLKSRIFNSLDRHGKSQQIQSMTPTFENYYLTSTLTFWSLKHT